MRQIAENAIPAQLARDVRSALDAIGWTRYAFIDRGQYEYIDDPSDVEALIELMTRLASAQLGFDVRCVWSRAVRLSPGDYVLSHHDVRHDDPLLECIADLSAEASEYAVHYRDAGRPHFVVPNQPLAISLVARTASSAANHTYVSKLRQAPAILRLVARFVT
jgi:hypothetical protein